MRRRVLAGNWKMHKTVAEALHFVDALPPDVLAETKVDVLIAAPFTALDRLGQRLQGTCIRLAAQNMHWEAKGAYTGEVSAAMLVELGVSHVLVGHSERREYFGDNDVTVNLKTKAALAANLIPVVCVGETLSQREAGRTDEVVLSQVELALAGIHVPESNRLMLAYEPVWAIGTGRQCDAAEANRVMGLIRQAVAKHVSPSVADGVRLLYGGSVKPESIRDQVAQSDVDGGLVGGASVAAPSFTALVRACR